MSKGLIAVGVVLFVLAGTLLFYSTQALKSESVPAKVDATPSLDVRLWEVPEFELTHCNGQTVRRADLLGRVWVAAFIFTRCPGPCPIITKRMAEIQMALEGTPGVRLASFTIDPNYDRPEVLLDYAEAWEADLQRWYFLTSETPETMQELAQAFKVAAYREPDSDDSNIPNITHGTNLLLVGPDGFVRALFSTEDPDVTDKVVSTIRTLLNSEVN